MENRPLFDSKWKTNALNGDEGAVQQLVQASLEPLFQFCFYRVGRNRHLCEEVVQETVIRAIADLGNYLPDRAEGNVFPWLLGIARNEIRRALAKEPNTKSLETIWEKMDHELRDLLASLESTPLTSDVLDRQETVEVVNATMSQLPPHYRNALEAKYVSHRSVREIAEEQATTIKAIESLLTRARTAFRQTFLLLIKNLNSEATPASSES